MPPVELDVLILGGGIAGLWTLDRLVDAGYSAALFDAGGLGTGQTIGSQGIIHGGGKYALRGVKDFAAVTAIREMPRVWREALAGTAGPDLSAATTLSESCLLWLPRGSFIAALQAWGGMDLVARAGLLATPPTRLPRDQWPPRLADSARAVFDMREPVVGVQSVLTAFRDNHPERIRHFHAGERSAAVTIDRESDRWAAIHLQPTPTTPPLTLQPQAIVLTAGTGNAALLERAGIDGESRMQRRPLMQVCLRGEGLPWWHGHCVVGGKTRLTITARQGAVWQLGGELAESLANTTDPTTIANATARELHQWLPGLPTTGLEVACYSAVRAEARRTDARRPSGVHVTRAAANALLAWPTKLAMAPLLADEVLAELRTLISPRHPTPDLSPYPPAQVAPYPWQDLTWTPVP